MSDAGKERPVVVLGVARSGTTLLKEMLTRHSGLAIPSESHFMPILRDRSRFRRTPARLLRDLHHVQRLREWGVSVAEVERRVAPNASFSDVIRAIYETYAAGQGKPRFGDKTPIYLDYVGVLERAFPNAQYVHIVRDGRDAALSYLAFVETQPRGPLRPRDLTGYACRWRASVERGRELGRQLGLHRYLEVRFEHLVADPEGTLRETCSFLGLGFETAMLSYHENPQSHSPRQPLLSSPPRPARSSWRTQMAPEDVCRFAAIAGDLLEELGYERALTPSVRRRIGAAGARAAYGSSRAAWLGATAACRCLPFWPPRGL